MAGKRTKAVYEPRVREENLELYIYEKPVVPVDVTRDQGVVQYPPKERHILRSMLVILISAVISIGVTMSYHTIQNQQTLKTFYEMKREIQDLYKINDDLKNATEQKMQKAEANSRVEQLNETRERDKQSIDQTVDEIKKEIKSLKRETEQKLQKDKEIENSRLEELQKQIITNSERVAMTSFPLQDTETFNNGDIIKFNDVKFSYGINNIAAFRNTGKFVVEKQGLYLISSTVLTHTSGARFDIILNGKVIFHTYTGNFQSGTYAQSGTIVLVTELKVDDNVWVQAGGSWFIYGGIRSNFVIVKIK